jgi:hypothetical protein
MIPRIAPRVQRSNFVSATAGNWKCIPRRVPRFLLKATLSLCNDGPQTMGRELMLTERPGKQTAGILSWFEVDCERALQWSFSKDHWCQSDRLTLF